MKKSLKISVSSVMLVMVMSTSVLGQFNDLGKFVSSGTGDGEKIMGAYIKPITNAFGYDMNAGWYNTAKVHKLLGFDLTFTVNTAMVPSADKSFNASNLGLNATVVNPSVMAPTIAGKDINGPELQYIVNGHPIAQYNTPKGINWGLMPMPIAQLGLGLIKGTEIIGRFVPEINIGSEGEIGLWGIGIKHSIKQWIPAIDDIPFLNLSIMGGYSQFHSRNNINVKPADIGAIDSTHGDIFSNQQLDVTVKSFTANAIVSIDLPVLTAYAGLGISTTKTTLKMLGNYAIPNVANFTGTNENIYGNTSGPEQDIYKNPLNMTIKPGTSPRLNIGLKFKMSVITLHFEYTYANYSIITAGLGISFR